MVEAVRGLLEKVPRDFWTAIGFFAVGPLVGLGKAMVFRIETPLGKVASGALDGCIGVWLTAKPPVAKPEVSGLLRGLGYFMMLEGVALGILSIISSTKLEACRSHTATPSAYL